MLKKAFDDSGFTLIELMIVIAIIGILVAIAIPNFKSYRQRSFDATTQSDLKYAMTAQEAYFVKNDTYANSAPKLMAEGYTTSAKIVLSMTGSDTGYTMTAYHPSGTTTWTVHRPGSSMARAS